MHVPHMHKDLVGRHVWRQAQTQGTIENFAKEDFNILNPREHRRNVYEGYYRMEFPLYQWVIAGLGKIFGTEIWLTRWFTFFIGLGSIVGMFFFLRTFLNNCTAQMGAWCFAWSPSLYYFSINPLPDNMALCFGIWGLAFSFESRGTPKGSHYWLSALLLALSTAVKLPFIIFYSVPFIFLLRDVYFKQWQRVKYYLIYPVFLIPPIAWYAWVMPFWDKAGIVSGGHNNSWNIENLWYYFGRNLWGVFPEVILNFGALIFFLVGIWQVIRNKLFKSAKGQAVLLLFFILSAYFFYTLKMIQGSHEYYLFVFYPIVFSLVALGLQKMLVVNQNSKKLALFLLFCLPIFTYLRSHKSWDTKNPSVPKELLNKKEWFRSLTPKDELCIVGSDLSQYIYFYYLDKRGYAFGNDSIPPQKVKIWIDKGAKYLYSDSRKVERSMQMRLYLDTLLFEQGNFRVFKLKSP